MKNKQKQKQTKNKTKQNKTKQKTKTQPEFTCDNYIFNKTRANKGKLWTHYSALKRFFWKGRFLLIK